MLEPAGADATFVPVVPGRAVVVEFDQPTLVDSGMPIIEQPDDPHLRLFTVDDERLWDSRPRRSSDEFALKAVSDGEWDAFYAALSEV